LPPHRLRPSRLFGLIGLDQFRLHPCQNRRGYNQITQTSGKLLFQDLFTRIWLRTVSAVARAVVIHVPPLLNLTHQGAPAVSTADHARECEVMSDLAVLFLMSPVQDFLHAFPNLGRHQRFVTALIALTDRKSVV